MTLSTLTDTELNERIGRLTGWESFPLPNIHPSDSWRGPRGELRPLPNFAGSLDALKSGPEKMLREAGWKMEIYELRSKAAFEVMWERFEDDSQRVFGVAPTEERARAEAVCQGLEAGK